MLLSNSLVLLALFLLIRLIPELRWRKRALLVLSVLAVFYFQPAVPIRNFDFWFPLITIALTLICWGVCCRDRSLPFQSHLPDLVLIFFVVLMVALTRLVSYKGILTASRPPLLSQSLPVLLVLAALTASVSLASRESSQRPLARALTILILALLAALKTPFAAQQLSAVLRGVSGQSADLAAAADLRWLGFSYIAFRLLSVSIDAGKGRKLTLNAGDFLTYVCFPSTLSAGPIDRADRFCKELNRESQLDTGVMAVGLQRIGQGLFKKFILADTLTMITLSAGNFDQFRSAGWAWLALCAFSFQLYFDFSGYSDIAIGLAKILEISLPENFNHPYRKPDIAKFWSSWHMTLTQWIRSYVFNPLTRRLRMKKNPPLPQWLIILCAQFVTMGLIGLWHGVTPNYLIWGLWNGFGLFIHQLYADRTKNRLSMLQEKQPLLFSLYSGFSILLTFVFVSLGWIWFVLPQPADALRFLSILFGGAS